MLKKLLALPLAPIYIKYVSLVQSLYRQAAVEQDDAEVEM